MDELEVIAGSIAELWELAKRDIIFLDDLRKEFRADLQSYIIGATLSMKDNKLVIGNNLYRGWLKKIRTRGFDYEIDFKQ